MHDIICERIDKQDTETKNLDTNIDSSSGDGHGKICCKL